MSTDHRNAWKLLKPHLRPRVPTLVLVFVLGAVTASFQTSVLLLLEPIWNLVLFPEGDGGAEGGARAWLVAPFVALRDRLMELGSFEEPRVAALVLVAGLALFLAFLGAITQYAFTFLSQRLSYQIIVDLRVRLARHLMGLSVRYHSERRFGDLLSRLSSDVTSTLAALNISLRSLILEPFLALSTIVVALIVAPLPTLGILVLMPLALWPVTKLTSRVRRGSRRSLASLGASVQALTQMFQGVRTVKAFGGEDREVERYREINESYLKTAMRMVRAIALTQSWTAFYSIAGVAVLVLVLGLVTIYLDVFDSGGQMSVVFLALARLNNHAKSATKAWTRVEESVGASTRILEIVEEPADVVEREKPAPISKLGSGVRFEKVSLRYPDGEADAVRDLDLDVRPGETLALVGASGAGKSTLVDLVARFIDPTRGRVVVDGHDLRDVALRDWTALYGLVGQVPFLFHASIGENISYGKPGATQEEIEAAARAAHIHDFVVTLPKGYDTDVADMGARLSGGQRQRITIARAILKGAPLLLLDEATSALDSESEREVQRALDELITDRTVIVIAHRLSTVQRADRIAVLDHGELVELGSHEELISAQGIYQRLYSLQKLEDVEIAPPATRGDRESTRM